MATNLGTAYVTILPSTKGIGKSLTKAFEEPMNTAGEKAGNSFSTKMAGSLRNQSGQIKKAIEQPMEQAGEAGSKTFGSKMSEGIKDLGGNIKEAVLPAADEAGAKAGNSLGSKMSAGLKGLGAHVKNAILPATDEAGASGSNSFKSRFASGLKGIGASLKSVLTPESGVSGDEGGTTFASRFSGKFSTLGSKLRGLITPAAEESGEESGSRFRAKFENSSLGLVNGLASKLGVSGDLGGMLAGASFAAAFSVAAGAAAVGAIGVITKQAVVAAGQLQQSIGGVQTMFKSASSEVIKNANNAYKTVGISANSYMQTATKFSAGLIRSLGGDRAKAAKEVDMAMRDMADNANKFGTDITSIQQAYQDFARGNFTLLDNLNLGFAGTKEGMEDLLAEAEKLTGVHYDINSLSDVFNAIHAVQQELGVTGTTAREAATTLEGSFNSMKASWTNFVGVLGSGGNVKAAFSQLTASISIYLSNLGPLVGNAMSGIGTLLFNGIISLSDKLPGMVDALVAKVKALNEAIISGNTGPASEKLGQFLIAVGKLAFEIFFQLIPALIGTGLSLLLVSIIKGAQTLGQSLWNLLSGAAINFLTAGGQWISNLWTGFINGATELDNKVNTAAQGAWQALVSHVHNFLSAGGQWISNLWTGFINGASELGNTVNTVARGAWQALVSHVHNFLSAGGQWISGVISGFGSKVGSVLSIGASIASGAVSAIRRGISGMRSAGADLVHGIWSGISGRVNWLLGLVGGFARKIINKVKSVMKIGSPSKVMRDEVGRWIPMGIAVGIDKEAGSVMDSMNRIRDELVSPFDLSDEVAAIGGLSGAGMNVSYQPAEKVVNQTINFNEPVAGPIDTARAIKDQAIKLGLAGV